MKVCLISHIGNSRENQEDNAVCNGTYLSEATILTASQSRSAACREEKLDNIALLAVSDGMGGHSCGEVASGLTVKYLAERHASLLAADKPTLTAEIAALNRHVVSQAQEDPSRRGMGATLCGLLFRRDRLLCFNVGDSRAYRLSDGCFTQLSKDHTEGQRLLDLKLLTEEELKTFPNRKGLYKYIGMRSELVADVFDISPCKKGDVLLLCTDGLTDALSDREISIILSNNRPLKEKGERLLMNALEKNIGHGDNITMIIIQF